MGIGPDLDQSRLAQHPEVPGDRGLGQAREGGDQFAGRALALGEYVEQSTPIRFGDRFEDVATVAH